MRTTIRIDDDLMRDLKLQAERENQSLTKLLDAVIRRGLAREEVVRKKRRYREQPTSMGKPLVDLTKALALSAALEDEAILEKLALGK